ncbi:class I SAM-dependent methyltransferase [Flavivirga spongiicola]|uniref:Class I SAM-dependent methyltransferase n=1 Tax=Flavivirga spongiicola TaxID=421621 RepID=A0ABU7XXF1_9FLAO|nr:class I SAM-dependent methyltransferase [Flavivirga sp. MEBiC05379]MDO5980469.1 class I SAM-dependent methyltransferase [Flavivirga sp. MEBiC05379]
MKNNLNKDLYSDQLFKVWAEKNDLLSIESYFIKKYLSNKEGKVIEAGTGGGRIIFEIERLGFYKLEAFDYVENMITFCNKKKKELNASINFKTADATNLITYTDNSFDYLIYLQQILCFVDKELLPKALKEAHRIGKVDSTYIFSFLNWHSKFYNPILSFLVNFFRIIRNDKIRKYELPWLNIDGKFNWKFLNKKQPRNIWFKESDIITILKNNGFSILEVKTQIEPSNKMQHIHIACKKSQ